MLIVNLRHIRKEDQRSWASGEKTAACMHSDTYLLHDLT